MSVGGAATSPSQRSARRRACARPSSVKPRPGRTVSRAPSRLAGSVRAVPAQSSLLLPECSFHHAARLSCRAQPVFFEGGQPAAPVPEDSGKRPQLGAVTRHNVKLHTAHAPGRQCVAGADARGQVPGVQENLGVGRPQQPGVAGGRNRVGRRRRAQGFDLAPVAHLDELDRPLDVAEATGAELDVAGGLRAARQALVSMRALSRRMSRTSASLTSRYAMDSKRDLAACASSPSPMGRARTAAWRSHVEAQRCAYSSCEAIVRLIGPFLPSGRKSRSTTMPSWLVADPNSFLTRLTIAVALAAASESEAPPTGSCRAMTSASDA